MTLSPRCEAMLCTRTSLLIALSLVIPPSVAADTSADAKRDRALAEIRACLKTNQASRWKCRNTNRNVATLVAVYRQGDKSVLSTLLQFTYLTDFYGEALVGDPSTFLTTLAGLPETSQQEVAAGLAGSVYGISEPRFRAIRETLSSITESSANYEVARRCLRALETENAAYFRTYFPPQAFAGRSEAFEVHWFSMELYALHEEPLWPPSPSGMTYRVTVIPAFAGPRSVELTVEPEGSGRVAYREAGARQRPLMADPMKPVSPQQVTELVEMLSRMQFWQMPSESSQRGADGAEWILEGVQDGKYQVVHRWCPGSTPFGEIAHRLFELAGHRFGGC